MPVVQQPFVIYVVLENTTLKQVKFLVKVAMWENTKIKVGSPLAKHAPVDNTKIKVGIPPAKHVQPVDSKTKQANPLAKHVPVDNIKLKLAKPLAKHVPVVLTALLAPQVVNILLLPVLSEPMPVVQQPFVIYVVLGNTTTKTVKRLVKVARWENTKTKREKHPARMIVRVPW